MTTLFDADPTGPPWPHTDDIDKAPRDPHDYLKYLNPSICPECCEDVGSPYCRCPWARMAEREQDGTPEIHIDMRGNTG